MKRVKLRLSPPPSLTGRRPLYRYLSSGVFKVSPEVIEALQSRKPVVALETTIYTHGFPYPDNVALASHLESVVRLNGGIPATIGVLHGVARVGLDPEELVELASAAGKKETMKVSRRDLPYITGLGIAGKRLIGGTTIAGTMILARMAGIRIFGTGGLGGVHRGGEHTMDISADLTELGRTPVTVISSGCKSFLDIPRTLEYLETQGVCVSTFSDGRTGDIDLPAFWTRESGVRSPSVVQDEKEAAAIIYAWGKLRTKSGLFFANPIPLEHSLPKSEIDRAIEEAVQDAERQGIHGHANTPFILERIKQLTEGKSIPANRALIESNVARATKVAVELSYLESASRKNCTEARFHIPVTYPGSHSSKLAISPQSDFVDDLTPKPNPTSGVDILVAGSIAVDLSCDYAPLDPKYSGSLVPHTSNLAVISQAVGGVGHNVATAAHLIGKGISVRLCSLIADDLAGKVILSSLIERGLDISAIRTLKVDAGEAECTALYVAVNDANKDLFIAMADMRIIGSPCMDFRPWKSIIEKSKPKWVVVDANWDESIVLQWVKEAKLAGASVAFEPVSVAKSSKLFPSMGSRSREKLTTEQVVLHRETVDLFQVKTPTAGIDGYSEANYNKGVYPMHDIELATPNEQELSAIYTAASTRGYFERQDWWAVTDALGIPSSGISNQLRKLTSPELVDKGIPQQMIQLLPFIPTIITKLGARGVLMAKLLPRSHHLLRSITGAPYVVSRNMSGDSKVGGLYIRLFPAAEMVSKEVVSVNGVGDTFLGALVAGLAKGLELDERLVSVAQKAAVMTLKDREAVSPELSSLSGELEFSR